MKVEASQEQIRQDDRWKAVRGEALSLAAIDDPAGPLATIDAFLRDYPDTRHRDEALLFARSLKAELSTRQLARDRQIVDELVRASQLPNSSPAELIDRARGFLLDHPDSPIRPEVQARLELYARKLDEQDFDRAREYSRHNPTQYAKRIERYREYLDAHKAGGRFISEALEAKDRILREWDGYAYRQAYDFALAHPADIAEIARRFRSYLIDQPDGRYSDLARQYLDWWDKVSVPRQYRVTLRRGEVEPTVGKYFSGGDRTSGL